MKNYCHLCGAKYLDGKTNPWVCNGCGNISYLNPSPTVDILLFDSEGRALLAERGIEPAKGKFDFPGGFVDVGETFEEALYRELEEELGLTEPDLTKPVYVASLTANYMFSLEERPVVSVTFAAKLLTDSQIKPKDDVASIKFAAINELDNIDFSLPTLLSIVKKAHDLLFEA